ncbi:SpoIIE family protein phosphatase [Streptomyces sp. NPDC053493]|uniref:SpoIIE family protein phosphatase n=1 Tax=Streptomyces sp. NPDC053493 TaxID=3365705 RepID=UPI0037D47E3E
MAGSTDADTEDVFGSGQMDAVLADVMGATGASIGLVYLLIPGDRMLRLVLVSGVSREIAGPWVRIPADAPIPVADAIRDRRTVWLEGREDIAHRYPRLGIVLPYEFMLAALPIADDTAAQDTTVWGGIVLLWPVWHPPQLDARERAALDDCSRRAARLLRRAADQDPPPPHPAEPRVVSPTRPSATDPALGAAAVGFAERLPVGCCALDLDGRITFLNSAAAELLSAGAAALMGRRPWEVLLWLNDPAFEDRYREAVVARRPTSLVLTRGPATRLLFTLYPDTTGISVHITRLEGPGEEEAAAENGPRTVTVPPTPVEAVGASAVYQLMHLAASLTEAAGVHEVVELAADQIVPALGPQGFVLMTVDEGRLRVIGHRGYGREFIERFDRKPLTAEVADVQVLETGLPVFFPTYEDLRRAHPTAPRYENRNAWAFLPLIASGRPVGSIILSYDRPRPFPSAERALLTSLAGLIAQALARARLYDAKHSLAHSLQNRLLPHRLPPVPGVSVAARYLPAGHGMDIGGDFYDLIPATPATVIAVIGDVQGHNTTAAALMGQVRTAVHAHATAGASPGDILARTNRLLTELDPDRFTSCLIAELDLAQGRLRLATAGHPPPLLRRPDGRTDVLDITPGLLLGITPEAEYGTTELPFAPGSVLALYTDGLVEAPGLDIGTAMANLADRLARSRSADLDEVARSLTGHAEQVAHRIDDVALLLVRREP